MITPTRILAADPAAIAEAAALIRAGDLVAFPTETVYGLGANAFDPAAVARIYVAKGRPASDPVIVHVAASSQLAEVTPAIPEMAHALIAAFWPGPLTLVLPRGPRIPPAVSAGLPTVAVRMPAHRVALALIEAAGVPIAAPSANLFARTSPTTARHVLDDLGGRIPLILDGGPTPVGLESTVLDLTGPAPRILRPGGVGLDAIARLAPDVTLAPRYAEPGAGALPAPGMLLRHYSPHATVYLVEGPDARLPAALAALCAEFAAQGRRVGLLIADEDRDALTGVGVPIVTLGSLADLEQVAQRLFAGLRELDAQGVDVIVARAFPQRGIGLAIHDRLLRAAEGRVRRA